MSEPRNCRKCGKVFGYISGGSLICQTCRDIDEADFRRLKDYLYQFPGTSAAELSTVLDISMEKIKRFLREGRLEIIGNEGNLLLECVGCGKSIKSGRYCDSCSNNTLNDLKNTAKSMNSQEQNSQETKPAKKGGGMRFLNK